MILILDNGLEYLSDSLEDFYCSSIQKKDAKSQAIYNLFAEEGVTVETEWDGKIKNFPQKLQEYRQWIKLNFTEGEIKEWIKTGFMLNDYESANNFRQKSYQQNIPLEEIIQEESWRDIHPDFNYQLRKKWEKIGFTKRGTELWINSKSASPNDYNLAGFISQNQQTEQQLQILYRPFPSKSS